jgi:YVTN family beta-propeller protein
MATSNAIQLSILAPVPAPTVTVSATASGSVCYGTNIIFTASVFNAGSGLQYQWKKNGVNVGTNTSTYTDNAQASATISCVVNTSLPCASTITSNGISIYPINPVQPSVSISLYNGTNNICEGSVVTLTAVGGNGGTAPVFSWKKNGITVGSGSVISISDLKNGDTVKCVMTSNAFCTITPDATSNLIGFKVSAIPVIQPVTSRFACPGSTIGGINFAGTGTLYRWTNDNPLIGLGAAGNGNTPAFVATNPGSTVLTGNITATPYTAISGFAYITNSGNGYVSVVNLSTNTIVSNIQVGYTPWSVIASPDGNRVYVVNSGSYGGVSVINTATNQVISTLGAGFSGSYACLSPDGTRLYVSYSSSSFIGVYNTQTLLPIANYYVSSGLNGLTVSPDGAKLYAVIGSNIYPINTTTGFVGAAIPVGIRPSSIVITDDGSRAFVTNSGGNNVSVINTATNTVISTIAVGSYPFGLSLSPDGASLYVANYNSNNVSVINTASYELTATITVGSGPAGVASSIDGASIYVTNQFGNSLSVINTATNKVAATITGFSAPVSMGNFINSKPTCTGAPIMFTIRVAPPNLNTWTGQVSTDWYDPANWICGRIPAPEDDVLISVSSRNYYPVIPAGDTITIRSIRLETGTSTTLGTNSNFILTGNN